MEVNFLKKEKILDKFEDNKKEAESTIKDKEKVEDVLDKASKKILKKSVSEIARVYEDIKLMISLVRDWIRKDYVKIPYGTIISIFASLIYFVNPFDVFPDYIPLIGYIDDAFLISVVIRQFNNDMKKYAIWKANEK